MEGKCDVQHTLSYAQGNKELPFSVFISRGGIFWSKFEKTEKDKNRLWRATDSKQGRSKQAWEGNNTGSLLFKSVKYSRGLYAVFLAEAEYAVKALM